MKVAIMQPYFLPYIGYWQLISAVDQFVVLDDVHFINRGWINRNRIVVNHSPAWLTLPLKKASQNKLIHEIEIQDDDGWRNRMGKTLDCSYSKAPSFSAISDFAGELLQKAQGNLSSYLSGMISRICEKLQIQTQIIPTSRDFPKGDLRGQERILDICKKLGATVYINPPGGRALYEPDKFEAEGIQLRFLEAPTKNKLCSGLGDGEQLSIIDTLMHNSQHDICRAVADFKISQ
jgi:hypothetical protein